MTIKQLGGVFGRNPTFNDVTIEGTLTFDGGIDITSDLTVDGTVTADGLTVEQSTTDALVNFKNTNASTSTQTSSGLALYHNSGSGYAQIVSKEIDVSDNFADLQFYYAGGTGGAPKLGMQIASNGDISFYEDTGTTAKLFWDASEEQLNINSSQNNYAQIITQSNVDGSSGGLYIQKTAGGSRGLLVDTTGSYAAATAAFIGHNVGIGTTSPDQIIHAYLPSGTARIKAETAGATDASQASFQLTTPNRNWQIVAKGSDNAFQIYDGTAAAERMRIDSSGTVIVNNGGAGNGLIKINGATGNTEAIIFQRGGTEASRIGHSNSADLTFSTGSGTTERMRLDSSGNFLVGKTSASSATVGFQAGQDGFIAATRTSSEPLVLNRLTSDGSIASFRKDGTSVGSIGTTSGRLYIGDGDVALRFADDLDFIAPWDASTNAARDNAIDLGNSGNRFKDIYASNGTIQTSDRNEKQDIEALSDAEQRVAVAAKGLLRKFRWKSAVEEKGENARIHFGIIAQDLQAAFEAEGLDAGRYGMFINSTWTDEETGEERSRMGVRYSELLAFIIAAI